MDTTVLGRTGLRVSVVGLGCGGKSRLGQASGASFDDSVRLVRQALDRGITLVDTAALYGTEPIVGAGIAGRRDGLVLSTKLRVVRKGARPDAVDMETPEDFRKGIETSLANLRTDCIDILHLHGVMEQHYDRCVETLLPVIEDMRREGKVRFVGITERFSDDTQHVALERALDDDYWDVCLLGLNFVNQTALRRVLPRAAAAGVGVMGMFAVRGALASPATLGALVAHLVETGEIDRRDLEDGAPMEALLRLEMGTSLTDAAYRFCRHAPGIDTVLTGTGSVAHLDENIVSIQGPPLPGRTLEQLARIFARVRSVAPN